MNTKPPFRLDELDAGHPLRQHPFEATGQGVPEHYFDSLASRVQARIADQRRHEEVHAGPLLSWSWGRTMASLAGAGLVAALVYVTWPQRQDSIGRETLSGVSDAAIVAYLDEQGLNPDDLATTPSADASMTDDSTTIKYLELKPDAIRQYLDMQNVDHEQLTTDS
ncbi:hypothetical protein J2I47_19495 [Fibrella sp. HMF5335]|uniref:DUF3379 domain-containing protein n=1 Tax=Fibrella rubiginis TaxID=2817060 RepID=A0A939GL06_9BACT|nr:hypothetical protein [Fibrella rubiginis]MBO0938745.1 hypothetical protein [Fibrella rubiginis]